MARKRFSHLPGLPDGSPILTEVSMKRSVEKGSTTSSSAPERERGLGENDVGAGGERAIDDADIVLGQQRVGRRADVGLDRLLRVLVELALL